MKPLSTLSDLAIGCVVEIQQDKLSPRLVEMGLCKGSMLKVLFRAPFNGPMAIDLGNSVLSLRRDEAQLVMVEEVNGQEA